MRPMIASQRARTVGTRLLRRPVGLSWLLLGIMLFITACGAGSPTATTLPVATAATGGNPTPTTAATRAATAGATAGAAGQATATTAATRAATTAPTAAATRAAVATGSPAASPRATGSPAGSPAAGGAPNTSIKITGKQGDANTLTGAGATFPAALYSKWFSEYEKATGVKVNYQSIGSGGGIKSIQDATVDFGATDGPMTDEQLKAAKNGEILHIPMALGAVVPTTNIPNVTEVLKFTPETLAGIFLGEIVKWNDPKLVADNPILANVNQNIIVVHRSDGSGTTYIWTDYLSTVSPSWKQKAGTGTSVNWPVGLGAKGNEGVAGEVKQNPYSIGYVELIYAVQNKIGVGQVKNKMGKFITPSTETVTNAAAGIATTIQPDLRASIVDAPGENAYPISGFTWLLVYKNQTDPAKAVALTRMMWWATHEGQQFNSDLGYAPLPPGIVVKCEGKINEVTVNGQRAFPGK